jgi:hypothetical protein
LLHAQTCFGWQWHAVVLPLVMGSASVTVNHSASVTVNHSEQDPHSVMFQVQELDLQAVMAQA